MNLNQLFSINGRTPEGIITLNCGIELHVQPQTFGELEERTHGKWRSYSEPQPQKVWTGGKKSSSRADEEIYFDGVYDGDIHMTTFWYEQRNEEATRKFSVWRPDAEPLQPIRGSYSEKGPYGESYAESDEEGHIKVMNSMGKRIPYIADDLPKRFNLPETVALIGSNWNMGTPTYLPDDIQ